MHIGKAQVIELILRDGLRHARISCPANLIPSPGQYLMAGTVLDSPLPDPVFYTESVPDGLIVAPAPDSWNPGTDIHLRGPLGRGFELLVSARRIALIAFDESIVRLRPLIRPALSQGAAVVLVSDREVENLPDDVEVQPLSAAGEIAQWADWVAFDSARENLPGLKEMLGKPDQARAMADVEILVRTPVPCGGAGECGVCAVVMKSGWKMACKDGPVFRWNEF